MDFFTDGYNFICKEAHEIIAPAKGIDGSGL